jgi:hypothetical protein
VLLKNPFDQKYRRTDQYILMVRNQMKDLLKEKAVLQLHAMQGK